MKLPDLCAQLQADPEGIPWSEKVAAVASLTEGLGWRDKLPKQSAAALTLLAEDAKWEVRKAVADILHLVPDPHFEGLAASLSQDSHHFVRAAAQKALERRSKAQAAPKRRGRGLSKAEREFGRIAKSHGEEIATTVRDQAIRLFEGLVGASVHELTAILSALRGNMDSLAAEVVRGNPEAAVTRYVPRLKDTLLFMEHLLEDMRSYTEFPQIAKHTEVLADMVADAVAMVLADFVGRQVCTKQIALRVEVPSDLVLPAARKPFILALRNLIKNAHEAILEDPERCGKGNVCIQAWREGDHLEIRITDDGMGLDSNELDQVRKFIPGKSSKSNGTGFGLPIAQRYVSFHQGTLNLESTDGLGTTVIVRLPAEAQE
jgi:signal transduction histidine kinase